MSRYYLYNNIYVLSLYRHTFPLTLLRTQKGYANLLPALEKLRSWIKTALWALLWKQDRCRIKEGWWGDLNADNSKSISKLRKWYYGPPPWSRNLWHPAPHALNFVGSLPSYTTWDRSPPAQLWSWYFPSTRNSSALYLAQKPSLALQLGVPCCSQAWPLKHNHMLLSSIP